MSCTHLTEGERNQISALRRNEFSISAIAKTLNRSPSTISRELRRNRGGAGVWVESLDDSDLFVSAVTMGEIQAGIERTRDQGLEKAAEIGTWADLVSQTWNILPMDTQTFRLWARLMHRKSNALYEDAMIAATAMVHHLTVSTRNVRDFEHFDVEIVNPFE